MYGKPNGPVSLFNFTLIRTNFLKTSFSVLVSQTCGKTEENSSCRYLYFVYFLWFYNCLMAWNADGYWIHLSFLFNEVLFIEYSLPSSFLPSFTFIIIKVVLILHSVQILDLAQLAIHELNRSFKNLYINITMLLVIFIFKNIEVKIMHKLIIKVLTCTECKYNLNKNRTLGHHYQLHLFIIKLWEMVQCW